MKVFKTRSTSIITVISAALLATFCWGCTASEDTESWQDPLIDGMDLSDREGNFRLMITDAPADFEEVWVTVSGVEILRADGEATEWKALLQTQQRVNLLELQNDVTAVMGDAELAPGAYTQLRLKVTEGEVIQNGEAKKLAITEQTKAGVEMDIEVDVVEGEDYVLVVDFDAANSLAVTEEGEVALDPELIMDFVGEVEKNGEVKEIFSRTREQTTLRTQECDTATGEETQTQQSTMNSGEDTAIKVGEAEQSENKQSDTDNALKDDTAEKGTSAANGEGEGEGQGEMTPAAGDTDAAQGDGEMAAGEAEAAMGASDNGSESNAGASDTSGEGEAAMGAMDNNSESNADASDTSGEGEMNADSGSADGELSLGTGGLGTSAAGESRTANQ